MFRWPSPAARHTGMERQLVRRRRQIACAGRGSTTVNPADVADVDIPYEYGLAQLEIERAQSEASEGEVGAIDQH